MCGLAWGEEVQPQPDGHGDDNLRANPYEKMEHESLMYLRWYAGNMWLFVPVQARLKIF